MEQKKSTFYPWAVVGMLWVVALLNYMDRQMLSTMRVPMMGDIQELESASNFGRLMAIFLWIYGFMSPISGIIGDRFSRKWLIIGSLGVWSTVTFVMGYANTFEQLYVLRALMGVSEALYLPIALSLIADYHQSKTRSLAIGIHMTGLYVGQAIGGFGASIAAVYTWNATFHTFGLIGIAYSILLVFLLQDKKREISTSKTENILKKISITKSLAMLLSNISFWIILFYFCVPSLPGWATKNWLPTLFSDSLSIDMATAGPLATISIAFSSLIGVLFGGYLSDCWVIKNVRGRVFTGAIGIGLTIPSLLFIGFGNTLFFLILGTFLFGIGFGMFDANNMPILCQFVSSRYRATAYGIMNMCGVFAGAFITSLLGKSTDDGNLGRDFALMSGIILIMLIIQITCLRPKVIDFKEKI